MTIVKDRMKDSMPSGRGRSGYKDLPYPVPTSPSASATMRANRRTGTRPEVLVRSLLHRDGYRFRKDCAVAIDRGVVRPDILFPRYKLAVFIDGCFWHRCPDHGLVPRSNPAYWGPKLARNVERDRRVDSALARAGWWTVRIWEHVTPKDAATQVKQALQGLGA